MATQKKHKIVIIPPLEVYRTSPQRRRILATTQNFDDIPTGSLILTPHTPPGPDEPSEILTNKFSQEIEKFLYLKS